MLNRDCLPTANLQVRKAVRSGTAAALVAAVDIQETNPCAAARRCCSAQVCARMPGADEVDLRIAGCKPLAPDWPPAASQ